MKFKNKEFIKQDLKIILFYFFLSLTLTSFFIGYENLNVFNTKWLFLGDDRSAHQIGWYFFKDDYWRFPLGSNPNYGHDIGNSIVYSDSIPLFALLFKLISFLLPEQFQYFSIWFILCFFLQGLLSYFLILKITESKKISIVLSFFFLLFPPAIYRIDWHPALFAHWTLILTVFLMLKRDYNVDKSWILLILLTSLIHFYFTIINLIFFNLIKLFNYINKKISLKNYLFSILACHTALIILMYVVGYFEVRVVDTFALGFGTYKLNLLSILDSTNSHTGTSWSWIIPDLILSNGEELEGFNFLGLGGLLLLIFGFYLLITNKKLRNSVNKIFINGTYISLVVIFLFSLSNNISIGNLKIISIPLTDYLYGPLSIIRSSGRLFWIVSYFLIFVSIFLVHKKFKKKSFYIFSMIIMIQLIDTSSNLKFYTNRENKEDVKINSDFWKNYEISKLNKIFTTNPVNYNRHFDKLAYFMETNNIKKTNIIKMARADRSKSANNRYRLVKNFNEKNLEDETIYVVDNIGHLLSLKEIFKNENVGFFFKDNIWLMINGKKDLMNEKDKRIFDSLNLYEPKFSKKNRLVFNNPNHFVGFGWSHNFSEKGIWSEGNFSNLLFEINEEKKNILFEMDIIPFVNEKNEQLDIGVYVNGKFNNQLKFVFEKNSSSKKSKVNFKIKNENVTDNTVNIEFRNLNPKSPLDLLISPDSRKLNFLLLNFNFLKENT